MFKNRYNAAKSFVRHNAVKIGGTVGTMVLSAQVHATTVLDAATKTAVTAGFTDLKDTLLDVVTTGIPYVITGAVILAAPKIIKGMIHNAASR